MRFRNLLRVLLIFLLSNFVFGQALEYRRHVQGNLFLPPGTAAQNSRIRIQLKYCSGTVGRVPVNPGNPPGPSGIIVSFVPFEVTVQANGSWSTDLYGNDQIICGTDMSGPSRWLIQPVFNGVANAGGEYQIQSCGPIPYTSCAPFLPDSAPSCSLTVTTNCNVNGGVVGPDTWVTINGIVPVPNALDFNSKLLPPSGSTPVTFMMNGNNVSAYVTGTGGGGGGGGITGATPNGGLLQSGSTLGLITTCTTNQYLSWNGTSWICTTLTGGGGGTFPTIPTWNIFASTGTGGAQDSGVAAQLGFLRAQVLESTGDLNPSAPVGFTPPNGSIEYFPTGAYGVGGANGLAIHFSHSSISNGTSPGFGNGGIALGGGNASGANYQIYLDCESTPLGCDFKVPLTCSGTACGGGGGGGGLPVIPQYNLFGSTGAGAANDSGVKGSGGFLETQTLAVTGGPGVPPFTLPPNASVEYFPSGGYGLTNANGITFLAAHSSGSTAASNGGVALLGSNSSGSGFQVYLNCEMSGCNFMGTNPPTFNGSPLGGGGSGTITGPTPNGGLVQSGTTLGMLTNCTSGQYLSWNGTTWGCTTLTAASGTVSAGTVNRFAYYTGTTTVGSNAHLDDSLTTANTITSTETLATPQVNLTGTGGPAMTGSGGTLPTPTAGVGGVGIATGAIPEISVNGGAWTPIVAAATTGCTSGQVLSWNGTAWACAAAGGALTNPIVLPYATGTLPTPPAGSGAFGINSSGAPEYYNGGWWPMIRITAPSTSFSGPQVNFITGTSATNPALPTNGYPVTFVGSVGTDNMIASVVGDGTATDCLIGTGVFAACPGTGGGGMTWPAAAGIANYAGGNAWGTSYSSTNTIPANFISTLNQSTTGNAATATNLSTNGTANQVWGMNAGATAQGWQTVTAGGGSGTVSPNNGSAGAAAYYPTNSGSTTVSPSSIVFNTTAVNTCNLPAINAGGGGGVAWTQNTTTLTLCAGGGDQLRVNSGYMQFNGAFSAGATIGSSPDIAIGRRTAGLLTINNTGNVSGENGYVASANSCPISTDVSFDGTPVSICSQTLSSIARSWIVHCVLPWNFTGGTGTAQINIAVNQANYAGPASPAGVYWSTMLRSSSGPLMGDVVQNAAGATTLITASNLSLTDGFIYTATLDGLAIVPSTGSAFSIQFSITGGTSPTGAVRAGAYCRFE